MAVCRAYARASFPLAGDLTVVMTHLNDLLVKDLQSERYVTFVVAWLDPADSRAELISAGHGPLLLYNVASDRFQSVEPQGVPLGLFPGLLIAHRIASRWRRATCWCWPQMDSSNGPTRKTSSSVWRDCKKPSALPAIFRQGKSSRTFIRQWWSLPVELGSRMISQRWW